MSETFVLLHGSANGSYSWGPVREALLASGARVVVPDMLGYGHAPAADESWSIAAETAHLAHTLAQVRGGLHLVPHSLGVLFALHLRRTLGDRVTRMTLIDPVVVSVLRQTGEREAYAEMEAIFERFMHAPDDATAARIFVEHWNGDGAWDWIGRKARAVITSLMPKVRREVLAARDDETPLATLVQSAPPTTILVGADTRIAPRAAARQLARALDAPLYEVAGAGHMVPLTHPTAVVAELLGRAQPLRQAI